MNKSNLITKNEKMFLVKIMYKNKLKELREELELKQSDISKILNIKSGVYSLYETEYVIIPSKHLITLCDFFRVSIDYLFDFTNIKNYEILNHYIDTKICGQRLKEFRKEKKLTQDKLAKDLNTTQSVIADYERGRYLIATPFLYTICKKYNISADYLLGKTNKPKYLM